MKIKYNGQVMNLPTTNVINDTNSSPHSTWSSQKIEESLSGKSDSTHNHDNKYYTKSQTDSKLEEKLDVSGGTITGDVSLTVGSSDVSLIPVNGSLRLRNYQDRGSDYYTEISINDHSAGFITNDEDGTTTKTVLHTGNMDLYNYQKIINTTTAPTAGEASSYPDGTLVVVYE